MILGTKNASGGPKIDIGGPGPKPYINVTFWGDFFTPRGRKTSFGAEKCDLGRNFQFFRFWGDPCGPGRLRNLNNPTGILRFPARAGQGPLRILKTQFRGQISPNFMKIPKKWFETNIFMKNQILGCPGRNVRAATIEKA